MKKVLITLGIVGLMFSSIQANEVSSELNAKIKKCAACHGSDFTKKALNKSQIVSDFSNENLVASLKGYKDGSYGGAMKVLMKGQLNTWTDEDIVNFANYLKPVKK